jgi:hypothetical protein
MNNTMFSGSICLTDLIALANSGHSSFVKGGNGKIYSNVIIWLNDEPDKYGNVMSVQLSSLKEKRDAEGKVYVGNAKKFERQEPQPLGEGTGLKVNEANIRTLATDQSNHYHSAPVPGGTDVAADPDGSGLPF